MAVRPRARSKAGPATPAASDAWKRRRAGRMVDDIEHGDIRAAVRKLCERFPGEYWRRLDREMAYPAEFVAALTEAGFLASLIPEEFGGAGLTLTAAAAVLEEIQHAGCNG